MPHTPLRHHRDRQRQLALQEPRLTSRSPLADRQDRLCSAMWGSAAPVSAPSEGSFFDAKKGVGVRCDLTAQVAGFLFNAAKNGNVTAQIFWLKTRARWKEAPAEFKHSGAVGTYDANQLSDAELERISRRGL